MHLLPDSELPPKSLFAAKYVATDEIVYFLTDLCHPIYAYMVFLYFRPYMYSLLWKRVEAILISKAYYRQEMGQKDVILPLFWVDQNFWLQKNKPLLDENDHQKAEDDFSDDEQNQKGIARTRN